jgi:HAE1 family hydrophobic/amphiphilic exporter-1
MLPKITKQVITNQYIIYPVRANEEVENSVTKKVEDAVSSVEKLDNIKSSSYEGKSVVIVTFKAERRRY